MRSHQSTLKCALLLFGATAGISAPFQAETSPQLSSVRGTVTNAVTGERLSKAYVLLSNSAGRANYPVVTDVQGGFRIEGVEPGNYRLKAERQGFLEGHYGGGFTGSAVQLQLSAGQDLSALNIALTPQAVITGNVTDPDGDIWTHVHVNVFRSVWTHGRSQIQGWSSGNVNDQGEFRIGDLPPGRYYLRADPDYAWERAHRPAGGKQPPLLLQPTWYPGSLDTETAMSINLTSGQQFTGVDMRLQRAPVLNIRGELASLTQIPQVQGREPFGRPQVSAYRISRLAQGTAGYSGSVRPDGTFEIKDVPAGPYEIRVSQGFLPLIELGRRSVQLDEHDAENVSIDLHPPSPLKGTIRIEDEEINKASGLVISLESLDAFSQIQPATAKENGSFDFEQVGAERYRVRLGGAASDQLYLRLIRYGGAESRNGTFSLAGRAEGILELLVSRHAARLTGSIKRNGNTDRTMTATPQVVLIPDTMDSIERESETHQAIFDQNGNFSISRIRPGAYTLYAFETVPEGCWTDPEFLREIAGKGIDLQMSEGEARAIEIPVVLRSEIADILIRLGID